MIYTKEIPGFYNYCATKDGRIWSRRRDKFLSPSFSTPYGMIILADKSKNNYRKVHRLILETFVGPCPKGMECRHLNGNPSDNRLDNLNGELKVKTNRTQ